MGAGDPLVTSDTVGFGAGNRTPETSRVGRKAARSPKVTTETRKGLSRACVSVKSIGDRTFEVRVKGTLHILGYIRMANGNKGRVYSYKLISERRAHAGFPTQKAAITRMLEKC